MLLLAGYHAAIKLKPKQSREEITKKKLALDLKGLYMGSEIVKKNIYLKTKTPSSFCESRFVCDSIVWLLLPFQILA